MVHDFGGRNPTSRHALVIHMPSALFVPRPRVIVVESCDKAALFGRSLLSGAGDVLGAGEMSLGSSKAASFGGLVTLLHLA
jgi:hypothetical protein